MAITLYTHRKHAGNHGALLELQGPAITVYTHRKHVGNHRAWLELEHAIDAHPPNVYGIFMRFFNIHSKLW